MEDGFEPGTEQDLQETLEFSQPKYLFVDDEPFILDLLYNCFSQHASVTLASNGKEALDKTSNIYFDVIISDVNMPVLDGIAFFKSLHEKDPRIKERFLFCTGCLSFELECFCREHQIRSIFKPFNLLKLQSVLAEFKSCQK